MHTCCRTARRAAATCPKQANLMVPPPHIPYPPIGHTFSSTQSQSSQQATTVRPHACMHGTQADRPNHTLGHKITQSTTKTKSMHTWRAASCCDRKRTSARSAWTWSAGAPDEEGWGRAGEGPTAHAWAKPKPGLASAGTWQVGGGALGLY